MSYLFSQEQIDQFIHDGFIRLDQAFSSELAQTCQRVLWHISGCDPQNPSTWTKPVVWVGEINAEPFRLAANSSSLHQAFDLLVGRGKWVPRGGLGSFPLRFPTQIADTGDTGWHVDASFPGPDAEPNNYLTWRVNVNSRDRALLMLFLFSEVTERDAPTRIRVGSHLSIARALESRGEEGQQVTAIDYEITNHCPEVLATGTPGTVYLCHPFLVHAAQVHRGKNPRFMAQPPLLPTGPLEWQGENNSNFSPVEQAIRKGLGL